MNVDIGDYVAVDFSRLDKPDSLRPSISLRVRRGDVEICRVTGTMGIRTITYYQVLLTDINQYAKVPEEAILRDSIEVCYGCNNEKLWHDGNHKFFCPFCNYDS